MSEFIPALVTATAMPLTFSIAHGLGLGFLSYAFIKATAGRVKDLNPAVIIIAGAFLLKMIVTG